MSTIPQDSGVPGGVPEYRYEPLVAADAVRVLVVHPADKLNDPLRCSIVQYNRSTELSSDNYCSHQHYSAVSYTWGAAALPSHQLLIQPLVSGTSDTASAYKYLKITANVDSLLRHLRKVRKAVRLWIDTVCLNQMDEEEKAQQIPKMGDIYRAAKKVYIWLGNDNIDDARRAFSIIRQVELRNEWNPGQDEISLLTKLFRREWFSRRWIVQEAVLAHEARLHCGSCSLTLSWVLQALKKAQCSAAGLDALGYGAKMLLSSIGKYQEAPGDCSLLTLLWDLHLSECSDPRDRVAALYGLASGAKRPPDLRYNEGATQLYLDCAAYFINRDAMSAHTLILNLAEFGSLAENSQRREPLSWIPDWSRSRRPLLDFFNGSQDVFKALRGSTWPQGETSTVSPIMPSTGHDSLHYPGLMDYCKEIKHPTQMSAQGNVLRIHSNPLAFLMLGGIVEKVYCCESSDWKDVWSLFRRMANEFKEDTPDDDQELLLRMLLAAVHKDMWWEEPLSVGHLHFFIYSSRLDDGPSEEYIGFLEKIGIILSRYSLIRMNKNHRRHGVLDTAEHSSDYHFGPRNAAVDDILVPFMLPEHDGYTFVKEDHWAVSMCLRPAMSADMEVSAERCDPLTPFCRTVRWVGVTFNNLCHYCLGAICEGDVSREGYLAYRSAMEIGLPGPYVFDVI